jgi:hypothetical protein
LDFNWSLHENDWVCLFVLFNHHLLLQEGRVGYVWSVSSPLSFGLILTQLHVEVIPFSIQCCKMDTASWAALVWCCSYVTATGRRLSDNHLRDILLINFFAFSLWWSESICLSILLD